MTDSTKQSPVNRQSEMTLQEAKRLPLLSRKAQRSFPSSQGDPVRQDSEMSIWTDRIVPKRESFIDAIPVLVRNGYEKETLEIAANVWRLWITARDVVGGRRFLGSVLEATEKKNSRNRALALRRRTIRVLAKKAGGFSAEKLGGARDR